MPYSQTVGPLARGLFAAFGSEVLRGVVHVKVAYKLEVDEDGFPPISIELLNASPVSDDLFRIENAPFFAPEVSFGDVVRARTTEVAGQYEFVELAEASAYTSLSIVLFDESLDTFLMDLFRGRRCVIEYGEFGPYRVLAVAVPREADYPTVRAQLKLLEGESRISFAELAVAHGK